MTELNIKLTGWKVVAAIVVIALIIVVRLATFNDKTNDKALMRVISTELMSDYFPGEVAKLNAAMKSGDEDNLTRVAESVTSARVNIESVQTSYPLFDFSTPKDVVVKVVYSLKDKFGKRDRKTKYYLFRHSSAGNPWRYRYESNNVHYYLNFI